jgi:hypothetical protein
MLGCDSHHCYTINLDIERPRPRRNVQKIPSVRTLICLTRLGKNYQHFSKFDVGFGYDESYIQDGREPRPD